MPADSSSRLMTAWRITVGWPLRRGPEIYPGTPMAKVKGRIHPSDTEQVFDQ